ncbi:hypothetical protein SBRCBS47491_009152 [Sporothrix bragantina]|uniref:Yeast cell wall synthesis Kre9/Knh1-like N-terminal domain-containing protein n=1 Tax=Sporothrix bragantina TaxID=671064 RepID=A0ABP0CV18_9PEZI
MKLSSALLAATANTVAQALRFTNSNFHNITVGTPFNITWTDANGPVKLTLLKGASPAYFENMGIIASGLTDSFYVWTPNNKLLRDIYDIQFEDSTGVPIYSFMFELVLAPITAATTTTTAAATASTTYATTWIWPTYV